jgi:hypothetical protein
MSTNKLTKENIKQALQKEIILSSNKAGYKITYNPSDLNYRVWHWTLLSYIGTDSETALSIYNHDEEERELLEKETIRALSNYILR